MTTVTSTDVLPEVASFLAGGPLRAEIGGRSVASSNGEVFETWDPGSRTRLAEVYAMQPDDVDRAVAAAAEAFAHSRLGHHGAQRSRRAAAPPGRRRGAAKKIVAQIESLDAGKVLAQAEGTCRTSSTRCAITPTWRCTSSAARRWRWPGTRPGRSAIPGAPAASSSPGISPSC